MLLLREALPLLPRVRDRSLLAIDLGARDRLETADLLHTGWTVLALAESAKAQKRLLAETSQSRQARLTIEVADFRALLLPPADLIYAGAVLALHPAREFGPIWSRVVPALRPGGWFVGRLLVDRDSQAPTGGIAVPARRQVVTLLSGFVIELLRERESSSRLEFDVIARRRTVPRPPPG